MTAISGVISFVLMEPVTYAAHRWLMHGVGWALHKSHHRAMAGRFEANDLFPLGFSTVAMILFAIATHWAPLWPVCWGITAYGLTYIFVHDGYIHARVQLPRRALRFLQPLRNAHRIHHLYGAEPFGMLCPIVPRELRRRANSAFSVRFDMHEMSGCTEKADAPRREHGRANAPKAQHH